MSDKYPRMLHLPWSPGCTKDDRMLVDVDHLLGRELVVTEKMDGSNVCLERRHIYARSHNDAPRHESFDALKALHATIQWRIPEALQVFGEWLWAKHSIAYDRLPAYLLVFGVRDVGRRAWFSWDETVAMCADVGFCTVPELWRGAVSSEPELRSRIDSLLAVSSCGAEQEGVVVRVADSFHDSEFEVSVAKCVRAGHVKSSVHWNREKVIKNGLTSGCNDQASANSSGRRSESAERKSAFGKYAGILRGSEELMRDKQAEIGLEERRQ